MVNESENAFEGKSKECEAEKVNEIELRKEGRGENMAKERRKRGERNYHRR